MGALQAPRATLTQLLASCKGVNYLSLWLNNSSHATSGKRHAPLIEHEGAGFVGPAPGLFGPAGRIQGSCMCLASTFSRAGGAVAWLGASATDKQPHGRLADL